MEERDLQAIAQLMDGKLAPVNNRLDQMQEDLSDLRTTVTRVAVTQENTVLPQLKLLVEGHETLLIRWPAKTAWKLWRTMWPF